jgi:hypothetical protein
MMHLKTFILWNFPCFDVLIKYSHADNSVTEKEDELILPDVPTDQLVHDVSMTDEEIVKIQLNTTNELILLHNGSVIHPMLSGGILRDSIHVLRNSNLT